MIPRPKTLERKNVKHLQLGPIERETKPVDFSRPTDLQAGLEFHLNPQESDLHTVAELGYGNGGTVSKVIHVPTGTVMAKKVIFLETSSQVQKRIWQELDTLKRCDSEHIVKYYGQRVEINSVTVCMEFMDCGSLDKIYKAIGPLSEQLIANINAAVVDGINYLKQLNVTHRDLKPSNILVSSQGEVKLCDFGVSGVLNNSVAETFVGTSTYMSPERIMGGSYSSSGDVWSLGLILVELAEGKFPFESQDPDNAGTPFSIFELLQRIVHEPPPGLPPSFSDASKEFVLRCLQPAEHRMRPVELKNTSFYIMGKQDPSLLKSWAAQLPKV